MVAAFVRPAPGRQSIGPIDVSHEIGMPRHFRREPLSGKADEHDLKAGNPGQDPEMAAVDEYCCFQRKEPSAVCAAEGSATCPPTGVADIGRRI